MFFTYLKTIFLQSEQQHLKSSTSAVTVTVTVTLSVYECVCVCMCVQWVDAGSNECESVGVISLVCSSKHISYLTHCVCVCASLLADINFSRLWQGVFGLVCYGESGLWQVEKSTNYIQLNREKGVGGVERSGNI